MIVDETRVKVGGRSCWIYAAIDPETWQVIYIEPCFQRDGLTTQKFFEHIHQVYGEWPEEVVTDGGSWYGTGLIGLSNIKSWRVVSGGERNSIEGWFEKFEKEVGDFDHYFPCWDRELTSVKNWLRTYCWFHNELLGVS